MSQKTLVIVPTYNERDNLPPLIQRLMALPVPVEVLVVDDNSPDGTGQLADGIAHERGFWHASHQDTVVPRRTREPAPPMASSLQKGNPVL